MKKLGVRLICLLFATVLLCGALPLAGAVDTDPPLYQYLGYDSPEAFLSDYTKGEVTYEWFSTTYAGYLEACLQDEQVIIDHWGYSLPTAAEVQRVTIEELPQATAWDMTQTEYINAYYGGGYGGCDDAPAPLSVQLNGETVHFADAAPETVSGRVTAPLRAMSEALEGKIRYENGAITVNIGGSALFLTVGSNTLVREQAEAGKQTTQMEFAPYIKEGRTYIPVRAFAEALGLTVQWDSYANTVVLYDRAALIASVNEDFSVANQWLQAQPKLDPAQKLHAALALALTYTELDSIDGNRSAKMSGTLNVVTEGENVEIAVKFDLYALAKLLMVSLDEDFDMESFLSYKLLESDLKNATFDMIYNADENVMYLRCPLLFKLFGISSADMVPSAGADAWLKIKDVMRDDLYQVYTGLPQAIQDAQALSVGNLIVRQAETGTQAFPSDMFLVVAASVENWRMFADDSLTRNVQAYTAQFHYAVSPYGDKTAQPYAATVNGAYQKGQVTLHLDTGAVEGSIALRSKDYYDDSLTTCTFSGNSSAAKLNLTVHAKNQSIIELAMDMSLKPTTAAPALKPPAADKVVDVEAWINAWSGYDSAAADFTE